MSIRIRQAREKKRKRKVEAHTSAPGNAKIEIVIGKGANKLNRVAKELKNIAGEAAFVAVEGIAGERCKWEVAGQGATQVALTHLNNAFFGNLVTKTRRNCRDQAVERKVTKKSPDRRQSEYSRARYCK